MSALQCRYFLTLNQVNIWLYTFTLIKIWKHYPHFYWNTDSLNFFQPWTLWRLFQKYICHTPGLSRRLVRYSVFSFVFSLSVLLFIACDEMWDFSNTQRDHWPSLSHLLIRQREHRAWLFITNIRFHLIFGGLWSRDPSDMVTDLCLHTCIRKISFYIILTFAQWGQQHTGLLSAVGSLKLDHAE